MEEILQSRNLIAEHARSSVRILGWTIDNRELENDISSRIASFSPLPRNDASGTVRSANSLLNIKQQAA